MADKESLDVIDGHSEPRPVRFRSVVLPAAFLALTAVAVFLLRSSAEQLPAEAADMRGDGADAGEHDFGDAVVVFNLEYDDDLVPAVPWAFENARVERLGNVHFLTGTAPGRSGDDASRHWVPLADIVRMSEFESVESARRAVEESSGAAEKERPVGHRAVRRPEGEAF